MSGAHQPVGPVTSARDKDAVLNTYLSLVPPVAQCALGMLVNSTIDRYGQHQFAYSNPSVLLPMYEFLPSSA